MTIVSDPFDPDVAGVAVHAVTDSPTQRVVWIENGIVKNLNYDRYWAQKTGRRADGDPAARFSMSGGTASLDELIRFDAARSARHAILVSPAGRSTHDSLHRASRATARS